MFTDKPLTKSHKWWEYKAQIQFFKVGMPRLAQMYHFVLDYALLYTILRQICLNTGFLWYVHCEKYRNFTLFLGVEILRKGTVSKQFRANRLKLYGNCAFPQNFYAGKLGKITVFFAVRNFPCKVRIKGSVHKKIRVHGKRKPVF